MVKTTTKKQNNKTKRINSDDKKLKQLIKENEELKNKNLRLLAEFDNYKKRISEEKNTIRKYAGKEIILEILEVIDDLERISKLTKKVNSKDILDGVNMIYNKINNKISRFGVQAFDSLSQQFNPELHEAIMSKKVSSKKHNLILDEFQKGYKYHNLILRHAKVVVSKVKQEA